MFFAWNKYTTVIICQHVNCNHVSTKTLAFVTASFISWEYFNYQLLYLNINNDWLHIWLTWYKVTFIFTIFRRRLRKHLLVTVVFEVFLVAIILKDVLWVVLSKPLCFVNVKRTRLSLHFLAFSATWNRG